MDPAPLLGELLRAAPRGPLAVVEVARRALEPLGFAERVTRGEPHAFLFARGAPRVLFSGHVDVVPAGQGWTRDPHGGEVGEGRVWGRGACDMLGSVAAFVAAAARAPDAPCSILLTTDEETGMLAATRALDEGLLAGVEGVIVGEPTSLAVGIAEKGVLWMRIETSGRTAHGSMPELGDNAVLRLMRIAPRLAAPPGRHPLLGAATLSVNRVGGGEAVNQVPAEAWAEVDARYLPGTTEQDVVRLVESAFAGEPARVRVLSSHAPFEVGADAPLARLAVEAARAAGRSGEMLGLPYGTEASKFAPAGIPCVILGPGEPGLAHTARESIALVDLEAGARCYQHVLERGG